MGSPQLAVLPEAPPPGDAEVRPIQASRDGDAEVRLIQASRDGDAEAFARLYARYRRVIYALCLRQLQDASLAEDVVQDTFMRAYTNLGKFEMGRRILPWLVTIAQRRCVDLQRRGAKMSPQNASVERGRERPGDTTLDAVIAGEERGMLERALARLPRRQRRVLLLYALEGWNYSDIASAERASVGSVKSLLFRARTSLRHACETGVLGAALLPFRTLRRKLQRAADRVQLGLNGAGEVLLGSSAQSLSAGVLALALAVAGGVTPRMPPVGSTVGRGVHDATSATLQQPHGSPMAPTAPTRPAGRQERQFSLTETAENASKDVTDPAWRETPESTRFSSIAVSPNYDRDHTIFAAGHCFARWSCRGLFVSHDGGASWTRLRAKDFVGETLLLPPDYPLDSRIFAMGPAGLQESKDGGASFRVVNPLVGGAAISPAFESDPRILIGTAAIVEYWADRGLMKPAPLAVLPGPYATIAFSPEYREQEVIFVGGIQPDPMGRLHQSAVYRCDGSVCAGVPLPGSHGSGGPSLRLSPGFAQDGKAYAFTYNRLFASTDGGRSFSRLPVLVGEAGGLTDIVIAPGSAFQASSMFAAIERQGRTTSGGVYRSLDGGRSWVRLPVALPGFRLGALRVIVTPTGRLLAGGTSGGIACSEDGGRTWRARCAPEV